MGSCSAYVGLRMTGKGFDLGGGWRGTGGEGFNVREAVASFPHSFCSSELSWRNTFTSPGEIHPHKINI
jgi:hypothetical protein